MQDKIFKVKIFEVTHKSVKSVKVFCLEIFRLYSTCLSVQVSFTNIRNVCTQTKVQATISDVAM